MRIQFRHGGPRPGLSILEVLVAALAMLTAIGGIATFASKLVKGAEAPDRVSAASMLAAERLAYFRSQADPFRAVGGTQYAAPLPGASNNFTFNSNPAYNNNFNGRPHLLVREFLYGLSEKRFLNTTGTDRGRANQNRSLASNNDAVDDADTLDAAKDWAVNEVPVTPATWSRVLPNNDNLARTTANLKPTTTAEGYIFGMAPRANDTIREGSALDASIGYAREVWVQTSHPKFPTAAAPAIDFSGGSPFDPMTLLQPALPPYVVAVTVRVFPRDTRTFTFSTAPLPAGTPRDAAGKGIGYQRSIVLAEQVGYFGLRRKLR